MLLPATPVAPVEIPNVRTSLLDTPGPLSAEMYSPPTGELLVIRENSEILAIAGFRRVDASTCEIDPFKVSLYHHGRGLGGTLMRALLPRAAEAGYEKIVSRIMLWCPDYQAFYRRHGFAQAGDHVARALP